MDDELSSVISSDPSVDSTSPLDDASPLCAAEQTAGGGGGKHATKFLAKSFSTNNVITLKSAASNLFRKASRPTRSSEMCSVGGSGGGGGGASAATAAVTARPKTSPCVKSKNHSGALSLMKKKSMKDFQSKWCILADGCFKYFNEKDSLAIPEKLILLNDIVSLTKLPSPTNASPISRQDLFCFDVAFISPKRKFSIKTFGARTSNERETWLEKLTQSLSAQLAGYSMSQCSKLGWVFLKEGFAGAWSMTWLSLMSRALCYASEGKAASAAAAADNREVMDLKKTKDVTLRRDISNLTPPLGTENSSALVITFIDRSLYILVSSEKECDNWKREIEATAFTNGNSLVDQQMTADDIPVIVDKCLKFVFSYGCLSEGVYRHAGVNSRITRLLTEFRANGWAVQLIRDNYSEHDVANALKRFFRTLEEPLLTEKLRAKWMALPKIDDADEKLHQYRTLLGFLPALNYNTLRRLVSHLCAVAAHCEKNLMPNYNLAAIWGPTLLTVDGQVASDFAQTNSEADVCKDLIDNFVHLFDVREEELEMERKISRALDNYSNNQEQIMKHSGDIRLWVYLDTKTSGECVCLVVQPTMTALEMTRRVLRETGRSQRRDDPQRGRRQQLVLHEVILCGMLERPLHHEEIMLDVTLKWGTWDEEYRRDNYLLLKPNPFYEEAVPCAVPPLSVFSDTIKFSDNLKSRTKFQRQLFSISGAKITTYREQKSGVPQELESWPIEEISWYLGTETKRRAPHQLNITFIDRDRPAVKAKDRPFFGKTISFESRDLFVKWIAAMLVAEFPGNVLPAQPLVTVDEEETTADDAS